ncbi:MAG: hypothetical protein B9S32_03430 [Verrucomicrobia bacterium Tous-C9LFEB]|nr:MAG: hypothetical protein B9S32_03430 [Verrucomicrobia bacterium Tous-C9LFEB]
MSYSMETHRAFALGWLRELRVRKKWWGRGVFDRLGRMKRWLKRAGMAFGVLTLLIVALYLEENWRGARLWAQTKAQYEAKGFSFDPKSLIPPPVPDEQNFAKSEIWLKILAADDKKHKDRPKVAFFEAQKNVREWRYKNKDGNWLLGEKLLAPPASLFHDTDDELQALYLAGKRPHCYFTTDLQNTEIPCSAALPFASNDLFSGLREHALVALNADNSDAALNDILLLHKLSFAACDLPTLVPHIFACGTFSYASLPVLWQGLESHSWTDSQLHELENSLSSRDLVKTLNKTLFSDLSFVALPMIDLLQKKKRYAPVLSFVIDGNTTSSMFLWFLPHGSFAAAKSKATEFYILNILPIVDSKSHRIHFEKLPSLESARSTLQSPFSFLDKLLSMTVTAVAPSIETTGRIQSLIDMARVACGLERYRLANGKYPAALAELEPKFIERVPHDLCTGEPLHYRVEVDGNYALYSVGFNGVDDGGKVVMKNEPLSLIDPKQGDWVWPRSKK